MEILNEQMVVKVAKEIGGQRQKFESYQYVFQAKEYMGWDDSERVCVRCAENSSDVIGSCQLG